MADNWQLKGEYSLPLSKQASKRATWTHYACQEWTFQAVSFDIPLLECGESFVDSHSSTEIQLFVESEMDSLMSIRIADSALSQWMSKAVESVQRAGGSNHGGLVIILPVKDGHMLSHNLVEARLAGCKLASTIFSHNNPSLVMRSLPVDQNLHRLDEVFNTAVVGVFWQTDRKEHLSDLLLDELVSRLDLTWILPGPFARRTVALIDGGHSLLFRKYVLAAAVDLEIDLVVLDNPGHWAQTYDESPNPIIRFVPVDMTVDGDLAHRIVCALTLCSEILDGITTFTDRYLCTCAQAATMLSLPTNPVTAFRAAVDKVLMRSLIPLPEMDYASCDIDDTEEASSLAMIVKPASGGGSSAVFLTRNAMERSIAERFIENQSGQPLVERYLPGPEVDVNIALRDGNLIFAEVSDNLPTMAEGYPSRSNTTSWLETESIFPSGLPKNEISLLCGTVVSSLLQLGFRSGVFHCEARVVNSSHEYQSAGSRYPRLTRLKQRIETTPPVAAIIELNARAPGSGSSEESMFASGVNFYALQFLDACRDNVRFDAMARPFKKSPGWWAGAYVAAETGGTFVPLVMFEELEHQMPDLMRHVVRWNVYVRSGEILPDPKKTGRYLWVAWFIARSYTSREHLESITARVRESLKFKIVS